MFSLIFHCFVFCTQLHLLVINTTSGLDLSYTFPSSYLFILRFCSLILEFTHKTLKTTKLADELHLTRSHTRNVQIIFHLNFKYTHTL